MSYYQIEILEKYFIFVKKISPDHIKFANDHLLFIKDRVGGDNLKNAKIYYQGKLAASSYHSNNLAIIATIISTFSILISLIINLQTNEPTIEHFANVVTLSIVFILFLTLGYYNYLNVSNLRKSVAYTTIINLIDEVLVHCSDANLCPCSSQACCYKHDNPNVVQRK